MRDQQVPPDPFFSSACGTAMGSNDRAIDTPQLLVDRAGVDKAGLQAPQDFIPSPIRIPGIEQTINGFPRTKIVLRQVAPRRPGSQDPQNPIHDQASICRRTAGSSGRREQVRDQFPLLIRQSMSSHYPALRGTWKLRRLRYSAQNAQFTEEQFSNRTYYSFERGGLLQSRLKQQPRALALLLKTQERQKEVGEDLYRS